MTLAPAFFPTAFQKFTADVHPCVQLSCTLLYSKVTPAVACACSAPPPLFPTNSELRMVRSLTVPTATWRYTAYCDGMWLALLAFALWSQNFQLETLNPSSTVW